MEFRKGSNALSSSHKVTSQQHRLTRPLNGDVELGRAVVLHCCSSRNSAETNRDPSIQNLISYRFVHSGGPTVVNHSLHLSAKD